jgi:hypothetical protein
MRLYEYIILADAMYRSADVYFLASAAAMALSKPAFCKPQNTQLDFRIGRIE